MKRTLLAFVGLAAALSLLWTGWAMAADNMRTGDAPHVMANETINGTLYAAGGTVRIEGRIQGDLICAAQKVDVSGIIEGDVLCAAQNITISGEVQGNVRVAAQQLRLEGSVAGSASVLAQRIDQAEDSTVGRDLSVVGQQSSLYGKTGRDAHIMTESLYVNGAIGRQLVAQGTTIELGDKAVVEGELHYTSAKAATVASGARITGKSEQHLPHEAPAANQPTYFGSVLIGFVSFAILGAALLLAAPRYLQATSSTIHTAILPTLGAGVAGLVLPPFVAGLSLFTMVGTPLGLVLLLGWGISMLFGVVVSAHALGQFIVVKAKKQWQPILVLLLGLGVLFAAALIPFVGVLVLLVAVIWGVGAQWYLMVTQRQASSKKNPKKDKA